MKRFFCTGKDSDGSEVTANITDLSAFINAAPDDLIFVEVDDSQTQVVKSDIEWNAIQEVNPLV